VNAAGAWADRIAAMLGEPVPLTVVAPMLMVTSRVAPFIQPVVILRGRKLSFKQLDNGTVVIGGGHLATPYRDRNETVIDWDKLAISAAQYGSCFPRCAQPLSSVPGPASKPICLMASRWLGQVRRPEGVYHQFGFSTHGFQLGRARAP
jgi:sarcosine oxidase subunit beta